MRKALATFSAVFACGLFTFWMIAHIRFGFLPLEHATALDRWLRLNARFPHTRLWDMGIGAIWALVFTLGGSFARNYTFKSNAARDLFAWSYIALGIAYLALGTIFGIVFFLELMPIVLGIYTTLRFSIR